MSRNNDVFQVLVSEGNQAILAEGNSVEDLAPGQIGFFSYDTNKSLDATSTSLKAKAKAFYIARGIDDGEGNLEDVAKSAGTHIQLRNVVSLSGRCYTPNQPKIVELKDFKVECDTEYGVKFEIRNQQAYRVNGFNQVVKSFVVKSDNCDGCEDCPSGNCITLAQRLVAEVNADSDKLILAELIDGAGNVVTDVDAYIATNDADSDGQINGDEPCLGIRFTVQPQKFRSYCEINLNYFSARNTDILTAKIGGFDTTGTIEVTQDLVYEEGAGYDVRQLEYEAGGFNGKPGIYRVSELTGTARNGFEYFAENGGKYILLHLAYDQASIAGFKEHLNNQRTIIAIPAADATTRNGVATMLDALLEDQFEPIKPYLDTCPTNGTTVNGLNDSGESASQSIGTGL